MFSTSKFLTLRSYLAEKTPERTRIIDCAGLKELTNGWTLESSGSPDLHRDFESSCSGNLLNHFTHSSYIGIGPVNYVKIKVAMVQLDWYPCRMLIRNPPVKLHARDQSKSWPTKDPWYIHSWSWNLASGSNCRINHCLINWTLSENKENAGPFSILHGS